MPADPIRTIFTVCGLGGMMKWKLHTLSLAVGMLACADEALAFQIPLGAVRQIALVVADPGPATESRHGHAALRVSWGTPNERDLVVSFEADIPKAAAGLGHMMRGIGWGHYPSKVVALNYKQFQLAYQKETRGVSTYPLRLMPVETARIVAFLNRELASGRGSRPFQILNYNCAVMLIEALNAGLEKPIRGGGTNYPDKLPGLLRSAGLVSVSTYDEAFK